MTELERLEPHMHGCEAIWAKTYSLRNSVSVRCCSDALLSSSADWARLRKPKTLHGYSTTSDRDVVLRIITRLEVLWYKDHQSLQTLLGLIQFVLKRTVNMRLPSESDGHLC